MEQTLNRILQPLDYYALAEQIRSRLGFRVLSSQKAENSSPPSPEPAGGIVLTATPPRVEFRFQSDMDQYATRAKAIVIRHKSNHQVIAVVEIVSPGNKSNRHGLRSFVAKACEMLRGGVHLLIVDLFAPGPRDPQGVHKAIWDEFVDNDFELPAERRLTLAAYAAGTFPEAFVQPVAHGQTLPEMPLFLTPDVYVLVPLEATYAAAWADVPSFWQEVLTAAPS